MSQSSPTVCAFANGRTGSEAGHRAPARHPYIEKGKRMIHAMSSMSLQSHCIAGKTRKAGRHTDMASTDHQILRDGRPEDTHRGPLQVYAAEVPRLARTSPRVSSSCPFSSGRGVLLSVGPRHARFVRQRRGAGLSCSSAPFASFRFRVKLAQLPASFHLFFIYAHSPAKTTLLTDPSSFLAHPFWDCCLK